MKHCNENGCNSATFIDVELKLGVEVAEIHDNTDLKKRSLNKLHALELTVRVNVVSVNKISPQPLDRLK